jgi:predicted permease
MNSLWQDLRYSTRMLLKKPGFTLVAVITMALGIGANTAIYSVMHAAFFARYPIAEPDRLLRLYGEDQNRNLSQLNLSVPKFQFVRDQQTVFSSFGAANYNGFTLLDQGEPEQINGAFITANFLQTFGASPVVGRFFEPQEEETASAAVISESLWRERFGGDPSIIGRGLNLSGTAYTIVGVAPRLPAFWQADVWVTQPFQLPGTSRDLLQRGVSFLNVIGRLQPGTSAESAQQELSVIGQRYRTDNAEKADSTWNFATVPMRSDIVGSARSPLFTLLSAVGLVLLLACANVANLLLVRFAGRRREIALRQALGASRWRVVRQFWMESVMVSVLAAGLGVLLALWCLPALIRLAQNFVAFSGEIQINLTVLLATLGVALLTGLLMGSYPAAQASRCDLAVVLREGGRSQTGSPGQHRVRNLLVSLQVAVSLVLLAGAALLITSFFQLQKQPPGFQPDNVFAANLTLPTTRYPDIEAQGRFYLRLVENMRRAPGVTGASLVQGLPLTGANSRSPYARADGDVPPLKDRPLGLTRSITPGYFATMGIPLLAGRDFTERDLSHAPLVVIISRATARKLFADEDPMGRRLFMGSQNSIGLQMEIIGIVDDVRSQTLQQTAEVEFYRPVMQRQSPFMQLVVRTQSEPAAFAASARQVLKQLDAEMPLNNPTTVATIVEQSLAQERLLFTLLGVFAALALLLASVGIYSVVAYMVSQRTGEIGVRMALGAQRGNILRLILGQGLKPVALGVGTGLIGCLALGSFIQSQLYGVSAFDPVTLGAASISLAVVAAIACWLPARRAMRVDPMIALRYE